MRRPRLHGLGALLLVLGGCAALSNDTPWTVFEPSRTTLQAGAEERFRLEWSVATGRDGVPRLEGYVYNVSMFPVDRPRLLVNAFDRSGTVTGQRLFWLAGVLPTGGRTYFDMPAPPADHYGVTVWDFNIAPRGP